MTAIHWLNPVGGAFSDAADWAGGAVPGASDDAVLDAAGSPFAVTSNGVATVEGVSLAANATLAITGGTFTATAGTDGGLNAGVISVTNAAQFVTGGVVDNSGAIDLAAGATMKLISDTTLTGGGTVSLAYSRYPNFETISGAAHVTLTNADNTISGAGVITGGAGFTLVNGADGVIDGDVGELFNGTALTMAASAGRTIQIKNQGIIEDDIQGTRGGLDVGIVISRANVTGVGGRLVAVGYSGLEIDDFTVSKQSLSTIDDGLIIFRESLWNDSASTSNAGQIDFERSTMSVSGNVVLSGGGELFFYVSSMTGGAGDTLTNVDNTITLLGGTLTAGDVGLVNAAAGTIQAYGDSGTGAIHNAGLIETFNQFPKLLTTLRLSGAVENDGTIAATAGDTLIASGAITGSGVVVVNGGKRGATVADFTGAFSQDVTFHALAVGYPVAVLELAQSQAYGGAIAGFSKAGKTALDLDDIDFVGAGEASFSGTRKSGVLTVTDGTRTARIDLIGNYLHVAFVTADDGHGGTRVTATTSADAVQPPPHRLIAAMAGLGAPSGEPVPPSHAWTVRQTTLAAPHAIA